MRNSIILGTLLLVAAIIAGTFFAVRPYFTGIRPAWIPSPQSAPVIQQLAENPTPEDTGPFTVDLNFHFAIFAKDLKGPRVMTEDGQGNILVSETSAGRVSLLTSKGDRTTLLSGLDRPHGLAINDGHLFVAETGQVDQYDYQNGKASNSRVILDLPSDGRHFTRTIGIGPDGALYISVGSSCNICTEQDWRRQKILRYDLEQQQLTTYASGLRNAVFFTWNPADKKMYATEMGRDYLGDDLPPDEVDVIQEGGDYGFPYCYGDNIADPEYNDPDKCKGAITPLYELKAHEAPLGIDFFKGDLIIALHGSWNRSVPDGYEVIRLTASSGFQERQSLMSGFLLSDGSSLGRPAGVLVTKSGSILISDDKANAIYRLTPR